MQAETERLMDQETANSEDPCEAVTKLTKIRGQPWTSPSPWRYNSLRRPDMELTDSQKQKLRDAVNKAGDAMDRVAERFRQRKAESEKPKKK